MSRRLWLLLVLLFIPFGIAAQDESPVWCISAWYPSSDMPGGLDSIRVNADLIGVIHPFWYTPTVEGELIANDEDTSLVAEWREAGLKVIPSIFSGISQVISDPSARAFHIGQIVALVERMGYDGIDIDYEGFPLATRDDFSAFIAALSAELHERGKLLTIAVHAKTNDVGEWEGAAAQDWTRIAPAVDAFTIMTYDYTSRNEPPGPIAPTEWVRDVLEYAATITDLRKVRMGLPFYAYTWQRGRPPATTTSWESTQRLIDSFEVAVERDPADMEARIEFKARGLPRQTIYFADSVGIDYKLRMILNEFPELGGIAIWGIGGEDPANWEILRAARASNCVLIR
jgi:spore germination protein YaaH